MADIRKRHSGAFKFKVALEASKEIKTLNELASQYGIHQGQISQWKKQLMESGPEFFGRGGKVDNREKQKISALHEQIGMLSMELDWLKKKLGN